jgi:hypothetical protein
VKGLRTDLEDISRVTMPSKAGNEKRLIRVARRRLHSLVYSTWIRRAKPKRAISRSDGAARYRDGMSG